MRLDSRWTSHLKSQKDKTEFRNLIVAAHRIFERAQQILEQDLDASLKKSSSEEAFDKPAWAEYQASMLGEQRALRKIIGLLPKIDHAKEN